MLKGSAKTSSSASASVMPLRRLKTPARMVKVVWLKMTDPV